MGLAESSCSCTSQHADTETKGHISELGNTNRQAVSGINSDSVKSEYRSSEEVRPHLGQQNTGGGWRKKPPNKNMPVNPLWFPTRANTLSNVGQS